MSRVRRLTAVVGGVALTAVLASQLWGDGVSGKGRGAILPGNGARPAGQQAADPEAALARSKFEEGGVLTYQPAQGDPFFALQLKPRLDPTPRRPRDYLVLVSASAGQAGPAWTAARQIARGVIKAAAPEDRVALWCVSTPEPAFTRCLTGDFVSPKFDAKKVENALAALDKEYPAGDSDLKAALDRALNTFDAQQVARQRIVVYLGNGLSKHVPLSAADRTELGRRMAERRIQFFPIPLGTALHSHNLHALATGSGGRVVRVQLLRDKLDDALQQAETAFAAPILYPTRLNVPPTVTEHYPTRLPPLRPDSPTLVVGRMKAARTLQLSVTGTVAGRAAVVTVPITETVRGAEVDNFFLVSMAEQWKNAKDQHALIRADRALVAAFEQNRLDRRELLLNAQAALQQNELQAAARLYQRARALAPQDVEANAGLKIVARMQQGKLTRKDLFEQFKRQDRAVVRIDKRGGIARLTKQELVALAQAGEEKLPRPAPAPGAASPEDLLQALRNRMVVEEQKLSQTVEANLRQGRRELGTDPDGAYALLRSTLTQVRSHPDLSDRVRDDLTRRLENQLRSLQLEGAEIKLRQAQRRELAVVAMRSKDRELERQAEEERVEARFRIYRNLMNQARFERHTEEKILEGLRQMQNNATIEGKPWPRATQAAYMETQANYNLQVWSELKRRREQGFLAVMLEVEKSHIPYPDEPPMHFPPLATWQAITKMRKEKYEVTSLPNDEKGRIGAQRINKLLEETIDMKDFQAPMTLKEALGLIQDKLAGKYKDEDALPILVDAEAFKEENPDAPDVYDTQVKYPPFPRRMSVATALRLALSKVATNNATYLIRRNFIEVTTIDRQTRERVLRVYPVGDLVIPINSRMNPFAMGGMMMGGMMMGGRGMMGGMMMGGRGMMGGMMMGGGMGMMGGGMGMMGGMMMGGGMGMMGGRMMGGMGMGGMGMMGMGGMGMMGGGMIMGGGTMMGGMNCLGYNQFNGGLGFQGATQNQGLILLIQQLVAPGEWGAMRCQTQTPFFGLPGGGMVGQGMGLPGGPPLPNNQGGPAPDIKNSNTLGFYAPSLALVVRGTSRIHTNLLGGLVGKKAPEAAQEVGVKGGNRIAANNPRGRGKVAEFAPAAGEDLDPRKVWQDALAQGVDNPGLIIACADFLFEARKFDHAAEFLKANLRQGILVRPWVYEALAVALEASNGSPDEVRRARLSAVALAPDDARGYLKGARALAEHKEWERALAFCKQAATLEPNSPHPYADALAYAEGARDSKGMEWAAAGLLSQEWPVDSPRLHLRAQLKLDLLASTLEAEQHKTEADRMRAAVRTARQRDLVLHLTWEAGRSGLADLELEVKEPCGSVCSSEMPQSPGGGARTGNLIPVSTRGTLTVDESLRRPFATYAAARAFSGEYEVKVRRVCGDPLGGRARLEIILHQGTPQEVRRIETLRIANQTTLRVSLKDGRRTQAASVAPGATLRRPEPKDEVVKERHILEKLRDMADPLYVAGPPQRMTGSVGMSRYPGLARYDVQVATPASGAGPMQERRRDERTAFQTAIAPLPGTGVNLTATATVAPDQTYMRLSVNALFRAGGSALSQPTFHLPSIPGGVTP